MFMTSTLTIGEKDGKPTKKIERTARIWRVFGFLLRLAAGDIVLIAQLNSWAYVGCCWLDGIYAWAGSISKSPWQLDRVFRR
ncbi:hypothetical protein C7A07_21495 [Pseudomonas fragi]|nr:hypothetical protein C7A07_21495 [Pseudomonas fragi]